MLPTKSSGVGSVLLGAVLDAKLGGGSRLH